MSDYKKERSNWLNKANKLIRDYKMLDSYYFLFEDDIKAYTVDEVKNWYERIKKSCHNNRMTLIENNGQYYNILPKNICEFDIAIDYLKDEGITILKPNQAYTLLIEGTIKRFVTTINKKIIVEN